MTEERMLEIRFKMWELARGVMTDAANTRASMPSLLDDEYEYAREFLLGIAKATRPGGYREDYNDDDDDEFWCNTCQESIQTSHYHCGVCNEVCTLVGHPECKRAPHNED
jgi:hypothetical protein